MNFGEQGVDNPGENGIMEERYSEDQDRDEHGRWTSGGGSDSGSMGGFVKQPDGAVQPRLYANGGAKPKGEEIPVDSDGVPYKRPQLRLPKAEYAHVMEEINTRYDTNFKGKRIGFIDLSTDEGYFSYRFEIHDYNEYNIFDKEEF